MQRAPPSCAPTSPPAGRHAQRAKPPLNPAGPRQSGRSVSGSDSETTARNHFGGIQLQVAQVPDRRAWAPWGAAAGLALAGSASPYQGPALHTVGTQDLVTGHAAGGGRAQHDPAFTHQLRLAVLAASLPLSGPWLEGDLGLEL